MAKEMDIQAYLMYGVKGIAALAAVQLANKLGATIMASQYLSYGFYGVTVGSVVAAGLGLFLVDQVMDK